MHSYTGTSLQNPTTLKNTVINTENPAPGGGATASAPKVLFAEDAADLREVIGEVLLEQNYLIQAARDGYEAITMFPEFQPDLVILDMRMPMINGSDVCAVIRQTSDVPIIMFTAVDEVADVQDAITKGASDFVLKTTGVTELVERVAFHLAKKNKSIHKPVESAIVQVSTRGPQQFTSTTLIVDPDERTRSGIKAILARLSQDFIEVDTAEQAISAIKQHRPDILITEWLLPDMDAYKMVNALKPGRNEKTLITVVMSDHLSPEVQRKLKFVGIDKLLFKPLDPWKVEVMIGDNVKQAVRRLKRRTSKSARNIATS